MDDLSDSRRLNRHCPGPGKRGAGDLTATGRYGPDQARRMLRCRTCETRSSEREGTPLSDARLPPEEVESVPGHVAEGGGARQAGRLCEVAPDAVARDRRPAGAHARDAHDELVAISPSDDRGPVRRAVGPRRRGGGAPRPRRFSKDRRDHEAVTYPTLYGDNSCWPVRPRAIRAEQGPRRERRPAMAAGLADHVWSMAEWLSRPAVQHC